MLWLGRNKAGLLKAHRMAFSWFFFSFYLGCWSSQRNINEECLLTLGTKTSFYFQWYSMQACFGKHAFEMINKKCLWVASWCVVASGSLVAWLLLLDWMLLAYFCFFCYMPVFLCSMTSCISVAPRITGIFVSLSHLQQELLYLY